MGGSGSRLLGDVGGDRFDLDLGLDGVVVVVVTVVAVVGQLALGDRCDPQLIAVRPDEADLPGADAVVDAVLLAGVALRRGYGCSLLCNG